MKRKKIMVIACMLMVAFSIAMPVNAAKKDAKKESKKSKKQVQLLDLYKKTDSDIEKAEYLVTYLKNKNTDEKDVKKEMLDKWYIDIKTGKITKESKYKRHYYNDGWTIEFKDDKGKKTYSTENEADQGDYRVLHEFAKNKFLVIEKTTSIDEQNVYLGFMNEKGTWIEEPVKINSSTDQNNYTGDEKFQLGKGIVGFCMKESGTSTVWVCDANTNKMFPISNVWPKNLNYYNGKMIYQIWEASRTYEICSVDREGNVTKLHEEGTNLIDSNANGFLTDENGISFYDTEGNLKWNFDKYEVTSAWLYGKNVFVKLSGNDGNRYIANINQNTGALEYEPIRISSEEITGKYMLDSGRDEDSLKIINLETGESKNSIDVPRKYISDVKYCGNGIFVFAPSSEKNNVNDCRIFNVKGKEIIPYIEK